MKCVMDLQIILILGFFCMILHTSLYAASIKVGLVMDDALLNDRIINEGAYNGLVQSEKKLGIRGTAVKAKNEADYLNLMNRFALAGYDLIIGVGHHMAGAAKESAGKFPQTKYLLIDVSLKGYSNISSAIFASQEIGFLAGALSAMVDRDQSIQLPVRHNGILGFIGIAITSSVRRELAGFSQGAYYINPDIKIIQRMMDGYESAEIVKQMAFEQYSKGADIIYHVAGDSSEGVTQASKEFDFLSIGSSNYRSQDDEHVLILKHKHYHEVVFRTVKDLLNGSFKSGVNLFDLKKGAINISQLNKKVPYYINYQLNKIKKDIISENIKVGLDVPDLVKKQNF